MNVAVVDVGSNTIRLLVATRDGEGVAAVADGKRAVGLGADIERTGAVSAAKLAEASECLSGFAEIAHAAGAMLVDIVVASPGRQARNADQLVHVLSRAACAPARVLSRDEEGRLAFEGAIAGLGSPGAIAVCDVGGGSTQIAIGTPDGGPAWIRSVDLGSLRLTSRVQAGAPPSKADVAALRAEAGAAFEHVTPPLPKTALAVGGTARAAKKLVGRYLGRDELHEAMRMLRRRPAAEVASTFSIDPWRVAALPAGVAILLEVERLLGVPLEVGRGGLREGLALELLDRLPAVQARGR